MFEREYAGKNDAKAARHSVVIAGAGFGGLNAALSLARAPVDVTIIDKNNFHLFQPLLYQVATGGLSPANIAAPVRAILGSQRNATVILGTVTGFDPAGRRVFLGDHAIPYDTLIVAAGAANNYFGQDEWETHARGLKTIEDALEIRKRIFLAYEKAERSFGHPSLKKLLTFVVVGGGPTGVELAGTLADLAHLTLKREVRHIETDRARIILVEASGRILRQFTEDLSDKARRALERLGVEVWTNSRVKDIAVDEVVIEREGAINKVEARTVLWAAGVKANPLSSSLAESLGIETNGSGRIEVTRQLAVPGHPEILVIGDMAKALDARGNEFPALAPVAQQQGKYAARLIRDRLSGGDTPPFRYFDMGTMATIGRKAAVADLRILRFNGFPAWLAWLFIHLMQLVMFENRVLVFMQWAWNYMTFHQSARLITHMDEEDNPPK